MKEQVIYRCKECSSYFRSESNDLLLKVEFCCPECGQKQYSGIFKKLIDHSSNTHIGACDKCQVALQESVVLICSKCLSKNLDVMGTISVI